MLLFNALPEGLAHSGNQILSPTTLQAMESLTDRVENEI